ncbi:hypothetical protein Cob_v008503 [Colletotrichum orbiculare MAFF 240422]|uniref:Uncharacterized protein n=1 Tax=Colletotrichum orbiculare (strain 104-T / ATCC 96160 / CBS 514.97 / LARS 414 / MAFF 240422) TaxID=1213857 RepID=A0A484FKA8_COLOR|nr:hypothetical protein Cob_v008503 [Colletotrichum orbiculare MAFF 240422]
MEILFRLQRQKVRNKMPPYERKGSHGGREAAQWPSGLYQEPNGNQYVFRVKPDNKGSIQGSANNLGQGIRRSRVSVRKPPSSIETGAAD